MTHKLYPSWVWSTRQELEWKLRKFIHPSTKKKYKSHIKKLGDPILFLRKKPPKLKSIKRIYPPVELFPTMLKNGQRVKLPSGYILIIWDKYRVMEHTLVLGGKLKMGYGIHHKNGNKSDNHPSNLEILHWDTHFRIHNQ